MISAAGFVSSFVTMVSSVLGFVALFCFTVLMAPVGAIVFMFYAARSVFDETDFHHRIQDGPAAQPV